MKRASFHSSKLDQSRFDSMESYQIRYIINLMMTPQDSYDLVEIPSELGQLSQDSKGKELF